MRNVATGAWVDTPSLIADSVTLCATIAAEVDRSRELVRRSRETRLVRYVVHPFARRIAGGSELDAVHIIAAVLAKLSAGTLPKTYPSRVWVGDSTGVACHVCDEPIEPRGVEYEVKMAGVGVFRVHRKCFDVWNEEREWYLARETKRGRIPRRGHVGAPRGSGGVQPAPRFDKLSPFAVDSPRPLQ